MNIYQILEALKNIEEAANPAQQAAIAVAMKKAGKKPKSEDSMASAEKHSTGPKFTGYWKGTDPRTPGQHMVGAAEGREIKSFKDYLDEYGMSTGGTTQAQGMTSQDPKQKNIEIANTKKILDKALGGTNIAGKLPGGTSSAAKTINDPTQADTPQGKRTNQILGAEVMDKILDRASSDPAMASQLNTMIAKIKSGQ